MTANPPDTPPQPPTDPQIAPADALPGGPKTSGHAVASLILGIVGPCTAGLASIAGLILGIVGLSKIKKSAGAIRGQGLAVAGIILSALGVLMLVLSPILVAILLPAFTGTLRSANEAQSKNNLKQLCTAAMVYATAHRQQLPPADTWPQYMCDVMGLTEEVLQDPADPEAGRGYAMNAAVAGMAMGASHEPDRTVLFFECKFGSPPSGGPELLPPEPRYRGGHIIAFCDGHVERVPPDELDNLIWDPRGE